MFISSINFEGCEPIPVLVLDNGTRLPVNKIETNWHTLYYLVPDDWTVTEMIEADDTISVIYARDNLLQAFGKSSLELSLQISNGISRYNEFANAVNTILKHSDMLLVSDSAYKVEAETYILHTLISRRGVTDTLYPMYTQDSSTYIGNCDTPGSVTGFDIEHTKQFVRAAKLPTVDIVDNSTVLHGVPTFKKDVKTVFLTKVDDYLIFATNNADKRFVLNQFLSDVRLLYTRHESTQWYAITEQNMTRLLSVIPIYVDGLTIDKRVEFRHDWQSILTSPSSILQEYFKIYNIPQESEDTEIARLEQLFSVDNVIDLSKFLKARL